MSVQNEPGRPVDDRSLGDIVGDITADLSTMVRSELELAKTEIKREATKAGKGAGMLGGAAFSGYLTLFFLSFFALYLLANTMDVEWAALIVTAFWAAVTAALALLGRNKMREFNPELETTKQTLKEDVQWAKNQK